MTNHWKQLYTRIRCLIGFDSSIVIYFSGLFNSMHSDWLCYLLSIRDRTLVAKESSLK